VRGCETVRHEAPPPRDPQLGMTFIAPRSGAVKHGGPKDDTPLGWSGPDSLFGGAGDDVLWGNHAIEDSTARDILFGGLGDDTVFCSPGSNVISGGPGDDVLNGGAGRSRVTGGPGNDTLNTRG
jgi:Ca2+-binding RTX toxin-like protein